MKKSIYVVVILIVILVGYYGVNALFTKTFDIPTYKVTKAPFVIALNESGTIDAVRNTTISAPRIRGLQITWLVPEGTIVKAGDPVVKFDASQQMADLTDNESNLKINKNSLERAKKEYTIQEKQLKLDLEKSKRNYDEKKHDAPRIAEEAKLEYELSQLSFDAKLEQLKADVEKAEVEVQRSQDKVNLAQKELDQMTLNAPFPGLVVYLEIWKGGSISKVQEGDSPWSGQGLINIPDLSEMMVKTTVSEVDAAKVELGQEVVVKLDAIPDQVYTGKITEKSTLARKKDHESKINVFDIEVVIDNADDKLKPGMSAAAEIIVERLDSLLSVPLEAVFEKEGRTIVYTKGKDEIEVELGRKNDMSIEIVSGLEPGDEICLLDPTLEEQGLPGDKADKPEINQPSSGNSPRGGRGGRGGN